MSPPTIGRGEEGGGGDAYLPSGWAEVLKFGPYYGRNEYICHWKVSNALLGNTIVEGMLEFDPR